MSSSTEVFRLSKPRSKYLMAINKGPDSVPIVHEEGKVDLMEIYFKPDMIDSIRKNPAQSPAEHILFETDRLRRKFVIMKTFFDKTDVWKNYDAIMMADDDVQPVGCTMFDIFELFMKTGARIGQPALTPDSYYAHFLTVQNKNFVWRRTNHMDFMCIIMTPKAIEEYLSVLDELVIGFGLDLYWGYREWKRGTPHAILDQTPMLHSRPVGVSATYKDIEDPEIECRRFIEKYKIPNYPHLCVGGEFAREVSDKDMLFAMSLLGYDEKFLNDAKFGEYLSREIVTRVKKIGMP